VNVTTEVSAEDIDRGVACGAIVGGPAFFVDIRSTRLSDDCVDVSEAVNSSVSVASAQRVDPDDCRGLLGLATSTVERGTGAVPSIDSVAKT
jgi:hypothetical protein